MYGDRNEQDEHLLLKELYDYRDICKNIYNKDYFYIYLSESKVVVIFHDYTMDDGFKYYLKHLPIHFFVSKVPLNVWDILRNISHHGSNEISQGIKYTNGDSGNLALFDWKYKSK